MRTTRFPRYAAALALLMGYHLPLQSVAADRATALSAALGGGMGDGMSDAGGMGHGKLGPATEPRLGRSESFRRQVARGLTLELPETRERQGNDLVARSGNRLDYASSSSSAGSRRL